MPKVYKGAQVHSVELKIFEFKQRKWLDCTATEATSGATVKRQFIVIKLRRNRHHVSTSNHLRLLLKTCASKMLNPFDCFQATRCSINRYFDVFK